jgi:hypothetical protein
MWQEQMERDYEEDNYLRPFLKRQELAMRKNTGMYQVTPIWRKALTITVVLPENDYPAAALHRADAALADVGLNMVAFHTTSHYDESEGPSIEYDTPPPSDWVNLS